jgi:hypothetical protein
VAHLADGALRRLYDEPHALVEKDRRHYDSCPECRERFSRIAAEAREAAALLSVPAAAVDAQAALARFRAAQPAGPPRPLLARLRGLAEAPSVGGWGWRRPAAAGLVAVALAATLAFTPLAQDLRQVFEPTQLTPTTVSVTQSDMQGLKVFSSWGDAKTTQNPELQQAASGAEAARTSGLPAIHVDPSTLPSGLSSAPTSYASLGQGTEAVTFNGKAPAKLQGTTLTMQFGPGEVAVYGDVQKAISAAQGAHGQKAAAAGDAAGAGASDTQGGGAPSQQDLQQAVSSMGPIVGVAEMRAPKVSSNGASLQDVKDALLAQPNLSPALRTEIQQFNNPVGNLPIPIPADVATAQPVKLNNNASATVIGDNTGLGAGVVWIRNGVVYAVAGTITTDQAVAIANSL